MSAAIESIAVPLTPAAPEERREARSEKIRIVEYSRFPRVAPHQRLRLGFTRDLSNSGMCLGVDRREPVGSLLRLCLRDIEGRSHEACVGRVVWTHAERDGRHWLGLALLTPIDGPAESDPRIAAR